MEMPLTRFLGIVNFPIPAPRGFMSAENTLDSYNKPFVPLLFDILIAFIFAPFGGIGRIRSKALDLAGIRRGMKVLELGCGTGSITKLLLQHGAEVTAVDGSHRMLEKAGRRARGALFIRQELEVLDISGKFDAVLFAFVLHELPRPLRRVVLEKAAGALTAQGKVIVLDHAVPATGLIARAWRRLLMRLEPPPVAECIEEGYAGDLESAGLAIDESHALAYGTAGVTLSGLKSRIANGQPVSSGKNSR
jgi:SAM-dependent methyltransferase